jgi:glycosyltransferase involved in cell wall biosynthesis
MSGTSTSPSADRSRAARRRVLLWGTYDTGKPRVRILVDGMRANGIEVDEVHADVWSQVSDKSQLRGMAARVGILCRMLRAYPGLIWRLFRAARPDVVMVSYPGPLDLLVAGVAAARWKVPLHFDVFVSLYDTIVQDRRLLSPGSAAARVLHRLEGFCLRRADLAFMDTETHALRIESLFALAAGSVGSVWVGAELDRFPALPPRQRLPGQPLRMLFYGQFIPLHGLPTIIEAARLLRDAPVEWIIVGHGQETARIDAMLEADPLPQVQRVHWVAYEQLIEQMTDADVCLGIFGTSDKAASVIPNKLFQIVAAGKPFITRDSAAIRELFPHARADAVLVPAGDAAALADAVLGMQHLHSGASAHADLRDRIGAGAVGAQYRALIDGLDVSTG